MDMSTLTTLNKPSHDNLPPDLSFSSYLTPHVHIPLTRKKQEEFNNGEIGVFSAEKYFTGVIEVDRSPRISTPNKFNEPKPLVHPPTPSVRSDSSWKSQIALLQQPNSFSKTNKPNKTTPKGFLAGLCCNCICSDSDSIAVEDQHLGQICSKKAPNPEDLIHSSLAVDNLEKQRKSLEVFGSPLQDTKISRSFRISRRMDSAAAISSVNKEDNNDNISDSDESSSDLFEIESISGKGNNNSFLAWQGSSDAATSGCVTPTTCYAPSEASIEWSVVTASAADFSVMADYEEIRPRIAPPFVKTASAVGETWRPRCPSILLGCSSTKALRVADRITNIDYKPPAAVVNDQRLRRVSDSFMMPPIRFPPENNKLVEYDSRPRQRAFSTLSIPRSLPPTQTSQLFYNIH